MTTARLVPVTTEMDGTELDAMDAWHLARAHGLWPIAKESFVRFRFGDGFTNSRALALQICLAIVPFMLALTGLAADIDDDKPALVLARVVDAISPGTGDGDALATAVTEQQTTEKVGEIALVVGLLVSLYSMTTAVAQIERGVNRIYGIRRDRKALAKYGRAAVLTLLLSGPVALGFLMLIGGDAFGDAMRESYGWSASTERFWDIVRWPAGLVIEVLAIAALLNHAPRRRQPALSWLALGAAVSVVISIAAAGGLAAYVKISTSFSGTYGPLAGVFALLLWAFGSAIALFLGAAVCAQLEALRAGLDRPNDPDPGRPHGQRVPATPD